MITDKLIERFEEKVYELGEADIRLILETNNRVDLIDEFEHSINEEFEQSPIPFKKDDLWAECFSMWVTNTDEPDLEKLIRSTLEV